MIKKTSLLLALLVTGMVFAQQTDSKNKPFRFEPSGRIEIIYPIQFGEHALADAHSTIIGYGLSMSFFNFKNLRFNPGFDRVQYKVTQNTMVGNFRNSNYTSIYADVSYEIPVGKTFSILPDVGVGLITVAQRSAGRSFGNQDGTEFRAGVSADYKFDKHLWVFLSARYIYTSLNVETNAAYMDYYAKATQLQLALGLRIK